MTFYENEKHNAFSSHAVTSQIYGGPKMKPKESILTIHIPAPLYVLFLKGYHHKRRNKRVPAWLQIESSLWIETTKSCNARPADDTAVQQLYCSMISSCRCLIISPVLARYSAALGHTNIPWSIVASYFHHPVQPQFHISYLPACLYLRVCISYLRYLADTS